MPKRRFKKDRFNASDEHLGMSPKLSLLATMRELKDKVHAVCGEERAPANVRRVARSVRSTPLDPPLCRYVTTLWLA
jgi:hypothetical protein